VHTPTFIPPMELLAVKRLPEGSDWSYEVKLDGYRAQAIHGARFRLLSRRGNDFSAQFRETNTALASAVPAGSVIDGELVAMDAQGRPQFQLLQNSRTSGAPVVFFAFDILMLGGRDVRTLPLNQRQQLLRDSVRTSDLVQASETFHIPAKRMISLVEEHGLEGVVAKRLDSRYESGRRSGAWQKLCLTQAEEFVVGGFMPGANGVDALLIGFYRGRELQFCANVRAGFVPAARRELYTRFGSLVSERCPFTNLPDRSPGRWGQGLTAEKMLSCVWVKPKIVVRCAYQEWTAGDRLRRVSYIGVCEDKDPRDLARTS
jgi:bifunctional non-homologous end joining protein LigD